MYLRHTTRVKDGKAHAYWRLVRSVRVGRKVVQQTVAQLGELDAEGRARARARARTMPGGREQAALSEPIPADAPPIPIRLDRVRLERGRRFGDVWLGWTLWRALHLDTLLGRLLPIGREEMPWATMAVVLVLARLCEPSSKTRGAGHEAARRCGPPRRAGPRRRARPDRGATVAAVERDPAAATSRSRSRAVASGVEARRLPV